MPVQPPASPCSRAPTRCALILLSTLLALAVACTDHEPSEGPRTLHWYINPDNGGQADLARACSALAGGRYRIDTELLPNDATAQREQLVRRLAARDGAIDLMSLDPPFVPEFANAGFLRAIPLELEPELGAGMLRGPLESARWDDRMYGVPFWANTQLLWYRKSVAARAGLDPQRSAVTWSELIRAAEATGTTVEVQGARYEGYMVWIGALIASAGGRVLLDPEAGRRARPAIDGPEGRAAAAVIRALARSRAANAGLSTAREEATRAAFQGEHGGFLLNWSYVHGAASEAVRAGTLAPAVLDDIGWARYPAVLAERASRPPLGGIHLAIGAFSAHPGLALEAIRCLTSASSQKIYMLSAKNPAARGAVYDDPEVRRAFPMADLIRSSIDAAAPRPRTPYYPDVSAAVVRAFHPPARVDLETPGRAARLIVDVLLDRILL
jgi:multiple sugar transport system substrate-binding protein